MTQSHGTRRKGREEGKLTRVKGGKGARKIGSQKGDENRVTGGVVACSPIMVH